MKNIIKYIIVGIFAVIFSAPAFAESYEHTIDYLMFQGYEYYGISATVETNIDTDEGMTLYVAIYNIDGRLLEVSTTPLEQNEFGERKVYRLKVSTVLDETMTVKAMILKDMKSYAKPISVNYNDKYNSDSTVVIPDDTADYTLDVDKTTGGIDIEDLIEDDITDITSRIPGYTTIPSEGEIEASTADGFRVVVPGDAGVDMDAIGKPNISGDKYFGSSIDGYEFTLIP